MGPVSDGNERRQAGNGSNCHRMALSKLRVRNDRGECVELTAPCVLALHDEHKSHCLPFAIFNGDVVQRELAHLYAISP